MIAVTVAASVAGLLLAPVVPARVAIALSMLVLAGLLGSRLLTVRRRWPPIHPMRPARRGADHTDHLPQGVNPMTSESRPPQPRPRSSWPHETTIVGDLPAAEGTTWAERADAPASARVRDEVYDAALESFPASDAPSWSALRVGPPALDTRGPVSV
jgi:hypothetical protein